MSTEAAIAEELMTDTEILRVDGLAVDFGASGSTPTRVIEDVGFTVRPGRTLALLGESGCGKSVTARAIMGVLVPEISRIAAGSVHYQGRDILAMSKKERRALRGPEMAMVFQDALVALNPVYSVGWQIGEPFQIHTDLRSSAIHREVERLMERMRIPDPAKRRHDYPHQFSGGMRQRLLLAMAIALKPRLLIADEPTTALDVTVQAQIMQLLRELRDESGTAIVLITHDLALVSEEADDVVVMYAGRIVESGTIQQVFTSPRHPYTKGLLDSVIPLTTSTRELRSIPGSAPHPGALPDGCAFHPRCPTAQEICSTTIPLLRPVGNGRMSACHFAEELADAE